ncbi:MAG TPA: mycothiol synthase [Jatrophihabitantaceae bacterium]
MASDIGGVPVPPANTSAPIDLDEPAALDAPDRDRVLALAAAAAARDGEPPLSDQALSRLSSSAVRHLVARASGEVIGYLQLDGSAAEVVGDGAALTSLLDAAESRSSDGLVVWSHGERSVVAPVVQGRRYRPVRVLHQLHRDMSEPVPELALADGVTVRDFVPGQDDEAWLAVNAAAFAGHPEQGRWTRADLTAREREPWFDPHGFLIAERGGHMIGFHWTKVHGDGAGEVYVLGVHPDAQGLGLGPALLTRGLQRLAERGCPTVLLYVDDDNAGAMRLYERFGFSHSDTDTQWQSPTRTNPTG